MTFMWSVKILTDRNLLKSIFEFDECSIQITYTVSLYTYLVSSLKGVVEFYLNFILFTYIIIVITISILHPVYSVYEDFHIYYFTTIYRTRYGIRNSKDKLNMKRRELFFLQLTASPPHLRYIPNSHCRARECVSSILCAFIENSLCCRGIRSYHCKHKSYSRAIRRCKIRALFHWWIELCWEESMTNQRATKILSLSIFIPFSMLLEIFHNSLDFINKSIQMRAGIHLCSWTEECAWILVSQYWVIYILLYWFFFLSE